MNLFRRCFALRARLFTFPAVPAAEHLCEKIRERNRAIYRVEVDQPGVKWRMFQEQCRKESRGLACLEQKAREKKKEVGYVIAGVFRFFFF